MTFSADYFAITTPREPRKIPQWVRYVFPASEVIATIGILCLLFVFWEVEWTNLQAEHRAKAVTEELDQQWSGDDATGGSTAPDTDVDFSTIDDGKGIAKLYLPRFDDERINSNWVRTIVKGTSQDALMAGPGFYSGSQQPGVPGNFAIAGHRDGRGAPFEHIDATKTCDIAVVETNAHWYVYRVLPTEADNRDDYLGEMERCGDWAHVSPLAHDDYMGLSGVSITTPGDVDVVAPVPNDATIPVSDARVPIITLTTCHPHWSNAERLVIHGALMETYKKKDQPAGWYPEVLGTQLK